MSFFKVEGDANIELVEGEEGKQGLFMVGIEVENIAKK